MPIVFKQSLHRKKEATIHINQALKFMIFTMSIIKHNLVLILCKHICRSKEIILFEDKLLFYFSILSDTITKHSIEIK